jgi:C4-dicarboxylate transporter DctM subunit
MNGLIIVFLLFALMLTGMPISISLGLTVLTFLFTMSDVPLGTVAMKLFTGIEKFEIMAIPFFILAGNFLTHGGVARRMINFATSLVGHINGGLGLAGVLACALFAAISGSSPATVMAIGSILLPAMVAQGYPDTFGAGILTTSGSLGILIPPSIVMVMYAVSTNASIGALFMAGVIPGLLLAVFLGATTWYIAKKNNYPRFSAFPEHSVFKASFNAFSGLWISLGATFLPPVALAFALSAAIERVDLRSAMIVVFFIIWLAALYRWVKRNPEPSFLKSETLKVWQAYWESIWGLLLILVVIGGIYSGVFTPTEAAAMSAVYAFVVAVWVYKDLKLPNVRQVLLNSAAMSAMLLYIITNAILFSFLMTSERIPDMMAEMLTTMGLGPLTFLLMVNVILLIAGSIMDPSGIILIAAPILVPIGVALGVDPIHLGIIMVVNMEIGMCTPPVGLNLYVASGITGLGLTDLTKAVMPWLLTMLVFLMLITYVPAISLWLPKFLGVM